MKFSQRIGITPIEKAIQVESIDKELRNSLWSILTAFYWETFNKNKYSIGGAMGGRTDYIYGSNLAGLFSALWLNYFKKPIDTIPTYYYDNGGGHGTLRSYFFQAGWYEVYEFIEFVSDNGPQEQRDKFIKTCNMFLERENAGYRFVDGKIIPISSSDEISEIESAIAQSTPYYGVRQHLSSAISLLSDKKTPNYRNSIKESISAVEALCKTICKDKGASLESALKMLENKRILHPALKSAFSSLYGYTNDADGIRHALMEESNLSSADARFMLISCSAFINYVIASLAKNVSQCG